MLRFNLKKFIIIILTIFSFACSNVESKKNKFLDTGIVIDKTRIIKLYDNEKKIEKILGKGGKLPLDDRMPEIDAYFYYDTYNKCFFKIGSGEDNNINFIRLDKKVNNKTLHNIRFNIISCKKIKLKQKIKTIKGIRLEDNIDKIKKIYGNPHQSEIFVKKDGDIIIYRYFFDEEEEDSQNKNIRKPFEIEFKFQDKKLISISISNRY